MRDMRFGFAYALVPHPRVGSQPSGSTLRPRRPSRGERADGGLGPVRRGAFRGLRPQPRGRLAPRPDLRGGRTRRTHPADDRGARRTDRDAARDGAGRRIRHSGEARPALGDARGLGASDVRRAARPHRVERHVREHAQRPVDRPCRVAALGAHAHRCAAAISPSRRAAEGAFPLTSDVGITTPKFRFTLGIRWAPLAHDTDGDGVLDASDRCPTEPAHTPDGCPPVPRSRPRPPSTSTSRRRATPARAIRTSSTASRTTTAAPTRTRTRTGSPTASTSARSRRRIMRALRTGARRRCPRVAGGGLSMLAVEEHEPRRGRPAKRLGA